MTSSIAWAGLTLAFGLVDVGFAEPRPRVMTKTRLEIDCAAARVTRVVSFGSYTNNWPM